MLALLFARPLSFATGYRPCLGHTPCLPLRQAPQQLEKKVPSQNLSERKCVNQLLRPGLPSVELSNNNPSVIVAFVHPTALGAHYHK